MFCAGFLFFGLVSHASAATYYVSGTDGNDTNCTGLSQTAYVSGSAQPCPWKTLTKVNATTFTAGDSIFFKKAETFTGNIVVGQSGTSGNPITFGSYGTGANPIINATGNSYGVDIRTSKSYITVQNIDVQHSTNDGFLIYSGASNINVSYVNVSSAGRYGLNISQGTISNVNIDHVNVSSTNHGFLIGGIISNLNISNTNVLSSGADGFNVNFGDITNLTISTTTVSSAVNGFIVNDNTGVTSLSNLIIRDSEFSTLTGYGIYIRLVPFNTVTISGTSVHNVTNTGIRVVGTATAQTINLSSVSVSHSNNGVEFSGTMSGINVDGLTVTSNLLDGVLAYGTLSNIILNNVNSTLNLGSGIHFIATPNVSNVIVNNSIFSNNGDVAGDNGVSLEGTGDNYAFNSVTMSTNASDGFNVHNAVTNVICSYCVAENNGIDGTNGKGDGYSYHETSTGTIQYSIARNNKKSAIAHVGSSNVTMKYNVFSNTTHGTIPLVTFGTDPSSDAGIYNLYNNVIYSGDQTQNGLGFYANTSGTVKNNIIYGGNTGFYKNAGTGTVTNDYNVVYGATTAFSGLSAGSRTIQSNPLFTDISSNNFTLQSTSPAIDTGTNLGSTYQLGLNPVSSWPSSVVTANQNSYGPGWDMGAYIYTSSIISPTVSISAPSAGVVSKSVTVTATAGTTAPATISSVQFKLDGVNLQSAITSSPYTITWDTTTATNAPHTLTAVVTDNYTNTTTSSDVSVIVDNLAPVITITGGDATLYVGQTYSDLGATALDSRQGDLTSSIITVSHVNTSVAGTYTVTYDVSDDQGNAATQATRTVVVQTAPRSGGGGCINCWVPPSIPTGGFNISINQNASTTSNRIVTLNFNAKTDIKKIAISLTGDFADASQENYSPTKQMDLCSKFGGLIKNPTCPNRKYTIYAKFYTASGISSPVATSSITLTNGVTNINTTKFNFTRNLSLHATGDDVKALQQYLNTHGFVIATSGAGSPGKETTLFGTLTYKALVKFQKSIGWSGTGFFGPMTREYINKQ